MTSRGRDTISIRETRSSRTSVSSSDPNYNPRLSHVLIEHEIPFGVPALGCDILQLWIASSSRAMSPKPLSFKWSHNKAEARDILSPLPSAPSKWGCMMFVNMADNNLDKDFHRRMEAQ